MRVLGALPTGRQLRTNVAISLDTFSRSECVGWTRGQFFPMELVEPRRMVVLIVHFDTENGEFMFSSFLGFSRNFAGNSRCLGGRGDAQARSEDVPVGAEKA